MDLDAWREHPYCLVAMCAAFVLWYSTAYLVRTFVVPSSSSRFLLLALPARPLELRLFLNSPMGMRLASVLSSMEVTSNYVNIKVYEVGFILRSMILAST